jgi:hypothetical protein
MASSCKCELLEIPTPFRLRNSRVLLLEPAGSCAPDLGKRLLEGTYDKPFILDQGALRFLQFDLERVQSLMRRDDPDALCLRYTRKMMTFLLFNPQPRRILATGQFYRDAKRRLTLGGVLVANISGGLEERASHFAKIREAFGKRVIALPVRGDDNLIVLAFRADATVRNWAQRTRLAPMLEKRYGLNFPRYVRRMMRSPTVAIVRTLT